MRVALDTNILLSVLLVRGTPPARLYETWRDGRFELVSCERQLEEFRAVTRRPYFKQRISMSEAGRRVGELRRLARMIEPIAGVQRSPDPNDDWLLGLAEAASADYFVTGDKSGLLSLKKHRSTSIITPTGLLALL